MRWKKLASFSDDGFFHEGGFYGVEVTASGFFDVEAVAVLVVAARTIRTALQPLSLIHI